jgi:hypothetical protein
LETLTWEAPVSWEQLKPSEYIKNPRATYPVGSQSREESSRKDVKSYLQ